MLSTSSTLAFDGSDWSPPAQPHKLLYRAPSVRSWGVTSIGRGFDWDEEKNEPVNLEEDPIKQPRLQKPAALKFDPHVRKHHHPHQDKSPVIPSKSPSIAPTPSLQSNLYFMSEPRSATHSRSASPGALASAGIASPYRTPASTSPTPSTRSRRRSSQHRVSLIAGRVSIAPVEPPSPPPLLPQSLKRTPSSGSVLSAASTRPPSPTSEGQSFLGGRNISDYEIEGEIGRGAYGLVKRAREVLEDGSLGVCAFSAVNSLSPLIVFS
ncbi:hypothetical protein FA13DRAFT_1428530 [Coprinellus micaceus]|uniref:Protein kinase domain-containing protein n=1 Tax=Coprinellus micaceus TaxID=71717 RepID=A0A4Y7TLD1_COPMI|nr:hypothetical protein FA13DRAFT_1428530 [Coprinellus micaceus]